MVDQYVLNAQRWLNNTYGDNEQFGSVVENGHTGWDTIYGLIRALQIELGITNLANNFGPQTVAKFNQKYPNGIQQQSNDDETEDNVYAIIQSGLFCKGYATGVNTPTLHFYNGTGNAIKQLKEDAGIDHTSSTVTLNVMKALLSMDYFYSYDTSERTQKIIAIQRYLNGHYENYIGLRPCDGVYGRSTNEALIYAIQAEEGLPTNIANGYFGNTTKSCCPTIPYNNVEKNYNNQNYDLLSIGRFTILLKAGLYMNGYGNGNLNGTYDNETQNAVLDFQDDYLLPSNESCTLITWLSIFMSCGDTSRDCTAGDTRFEMTVSRMNILKDNDMTTIGRYLTGGNFKVLRPQEPQRILDNNMKFFPIFQESGSDISYFTRERGRQDANSAVNAAKSFKIPRNTIIYFAVDCDPLEYQIQGSIIPYFESINLEMFDKLGGYYRIGIYSTRNTCKKVINRGFATTCFVSDMSTGYSGNMGFSIPSNWNFDQFYEVKNLNSAEGKWDVDKVAFSNRYPAVNQLDYSTYDVGLKYNNLILNLQTLYGYAEQYVINNNLENTVKNKNMLVLGYLRHEHYNNTLWNSVAGNIDGGFVSYVLAQNNSSVLLQNLVIPTSYRLDLDIEHLAATLGSILNHIIVADQDTDDLAGWAGDLLQLGCRYGNVTQISDDVDPEDMYYLIGCSNIEMSKKYFGAGASIDSTGFSIKDFDQDIDAISLGELIKNNNPIHQAFGDYYLDETVYSQRMQNFRDKILRGESYTSDNLVQKLINNIENHTMLQCAASQVFIAYFSNSEGPYIQSKMGYVLASQLANKIVNNLN